MKSTTIVGVGILAVLAFVLGACGTKQHIAKVGDTPIDRESYIRRLERMPTPVRTGVNQAFTFPAGDVAINQMIQEQILLQWAKEEGVYPSDQQVEARVQQELRNNPHLKQAMSEQRITLDDLRHEVRVALARFNLRTKGVTVTEEELRRFYEQHKKTRFYRPPTVRARVIQVFNPAVRKQIDDDLKRGFNFQSIVTKYTQNPVEGVQAGEIEYALEGPVNERTPQGQIVLRLRNVLQNTKPLQLTDWIPLGGNVFARFEVIARTEGRQIPFEEVRELIREELMSQRGKSEGEINLELMKRMVNTPVEIYSEALQKQYARTVDEIKKQIEQFERQRKPTANSAKPAQLQTQATPALPNR